MDEQPTAEIDRLRQTCADLEEIFRHSFDGIFVADGQGVTLMVNEGCERNYGVKAADLMGRHVSEFERKGWIRPVIAGEVARTGKPVSRIQRTHEGKSIMVTGIPLFDGEGTVRRVVINSRDMTELLRLQHDLDRARERLRRADGEVEALRGKMLDAQGVVLRSAAMRAIVDVALRVAGVDSTVLISGESGAGKEVIARLIHNQSHRSAGPFVKINCGALPRELLETELFGYEPGAFTGAQRHGKPGLVELAQGGTLLLDEIGEMPLDLQVKLLTVLQDRELVRVGGTRGIAISVRIIAATNRDLAAMVAQRTFRSDLFYRLNVVPIRVPCLAERRDDIAPLVVHFVQEINDRYGLHKRLSEHVMDRLCDSHWPGNVRELRNVVERLLVTSHADLVGPADLEAIMVDDGRRPQDSTLRPRVEELERRLIQEAVRERGSTRAAARALGISQSTVVRRMRPPGRTPAKAAST